MIPNKQQNKIEGNLTGDRAVMGFAKGAEKFLMSMFINLYSDQKLAIIRELANNAWDSHVEAGQTRPIEIVLPSPLSPFITVRDFGVGLSVDDIHALYSKYGASTKRETNDQTGFMGVGSKAPLSYTSQFTTISVKNGVRITVVVSVDEDGAGNMLIVDTAATDAPNGVEVQVPVKSGDAAEFAQKATSFFSYWDEGRVLINGKPADHVGGMVICRASASGKDFTIRMLDSGNRTSKIVMGGVAYPCDRLDSYKLGIPYNYSIIAEVPLGSVEIAPSREALVYSPLTNDVLALIAVAFKAGLVKAVQAEIETAASPQAAAKACIRWADVLGGNAPNTRYHYKGRDIPTRIARPDRQVVINGVATDVDPQPRILITSPGSRRMGVASDVAGINLSYFDKSIFVTGYDMAKFTPTHKRKLNLWSEENADTYNTSGGINSYVLVNFPLGKSADWIESDRIIAWADVNAIKLPRKERTASGRIPGSYDVMLVESGKVSRKRGLPGDDIDQTNPVFWAEGNTDAGTYIAGLLATAYPDHTLVMLAANRVAKFTRENPTIKKAKDVMQRVYDAWLAALTDDDKLALAIHDQSAWEHLKALTSCADQLDDPKLVEAVEAVGTHPGIQKLLNERRRFRGEVTQRNEKLPKWTNPLDAYHFWDYYRFSRERKHMLEYINSVYAWRNK